MHTEEIDVLVCFYMRIKSWLNTCKAGSMFFRLDRYFDFVMSMLRKPLCIHMQIKQQSKGGAFSESIGIPVLSPKLASIHLALFSK